MASYNQINRRDTQSADGNRLLLFVHFQNLHDLKKSLNKASQEEAKRIKECFKSQLGDMKTASAEDGRDRKEDLYFAFYQTLIKILQSSLAPLVSQTEESNDILSYLGSLKRKERNKKNIAL